MKRNERNNYNHIARDIRKNGIESIINIEVPTNYTHEELSREWETPVDELMEQVEEQEPTEERTEEPTTDTAAAIDAAQERTEEPTEEPTPDTETVSLSPTKATGHKIDRHGMQMRGIRAAAHDTHSAAPYGAHIQISYDPTTGDVLTAYHISDSSWTRYHDPNIIHIINAHEPMTMQQIADAVAEAVAARDINQFEAAARDNKFTSPARYDAAYNEILEKLTAILPEAASTAKEASA